jgi:hypothetical protein
VVLPLVTQFVVSVYQVEAFVDMKHFLNCLVKDFAAA